MKVKLRKSKMDKLGKGYLPIYKELDEKGTLLHYYVNKFGRKFRFNTLREAKVFAIKI